MRRAHRYVAGLVNLETDPGEAQLGTLAGVNGTIIDPRLYDLSFLLNKKNELMAIYNASIDDPSTYNFVGRAQSQVRLLPFLLLNKQSTNHPTSGAPVEFCAAAHTPTLTLAPHLLPLALAISFNERCTPFARNGHSQSFVLLILHIYHHHQSARGSSDDRFPCCSPGCTPLPYCCKCASGERGPAPRTTETPPTSPEFSGHLDWSDFFPNV